VVHLESKERDSSGIFATQLTILAKVLFLSYLVLSLGELFPPRLLNPEWQLHAINQLLQTAVAPLLGLAELDRGERILAQEAQRQAALQGPLPLTAVSVRTMLLALIFAVGFASGAQRRYSHVPLLQELTQARGRLRWPQGHGPRNGARHRPLQDAYLLPPEDGEWGEQNGAPR